MSMTTALGVRARRRSGGGGGGGGFTRLCRGHSGAERTSGNINRSRCVGRSVEASSSSEDSSERTSLGCLEWRSVVRQLARFAKTPGGVRAALEDGLHVARDIDECIAMQEETEEMMGVLNARGKSDSGEEEEEGDVATSLFAGFAPFDVALEKVERRRRMRGNDDDSNGTVGRDIYDDEDNAMLAPRLDATELFLVRENLEAAARLAAALEMTPLHRYATKLRGDDIALHALRARLAACIPHGGFGRLLSTASARLAACREDERAATERLHALMKEIEAGMRRSDERRHWGQFRAATFGAHGRSCFNVESRSMNIIFEEYAVRVHPLVLALYIYIYIHLHLALLMLVRDSRNSSSTDICALRCDANACGMQAYMIRFFDFCGDHMCDH